MANFTKVFSLLAISYLMVPCLSVAEVAPIDPGQEKSLKNPILEEHNSVQVHEDVDNDPKQMNDSSMFSMGASGSFVHGFIATLSVIIVSELGDKTFFIAAIMAMRHPRWTVFIGAMAALALMHVMSAFFGYAITVIPRLYTFYLSSFLFAVFGIKMLREGWKMSATVRKISIHTCIRINQMSYQL